MEELWQKEGDFVSEQDWKTQIVSLKSKECEEDKKVLKGLLTEAIEKRIPHKKFGVLFSGGVDSGFIAAVCKKLNVNFTCYTVGFQDGTKEPEDITEAIKMALQLGFELKYKIYNLNEVEEIIKRTVRILRKVNRDDVVNVGVGAVVLAAIELGKKDKIDYFLGGLGSEEIFAGYERHVDKEINEECWNGLKAMWSRDLVRDFNLAKEFKIMIKTPFLDRELISYAMKIPGERKINGTEKKIILREVAEEYLGQFAWRKKKAAQYGSCFDKAINKLAKKNNFALKKEYLDSINGEIRK